MIERAIILKIQKEQPNVQLFIKLILMIKRRCEFFSVNSDLL